MRLVHNTKFDTYGCLLHGQGKQFRTPTFQRATELFFKQAQPVRWFDNVAIITFGNRGKPFTSRCLDALGIDHAWVGRDLKHFWFGRKIPLVYEFTKRIAAEYIIWLDGFDVIPADPIRAMEMYWDKFDGQMLFGGQFGMWQPGTAPNDFYETLDPNTARYPNSGIVISPRELILKWVPRAQEFAHKYKEDQDRWNNVLPEAYPELTTDARCEIIQLWPTREPFPLEILETT